MRDIESKGLFVIERVIVGSRYQAIKGKGFLYLGRNRLVSDGDISRPTHSVERTKDY